MQKKHNKFSKYLSHTESQHGYVHTDEHHTNIDNFTHISNPKSLQFREKNANLLKICLLIISCFAIIEFLCGYYFKSLTLESDSLHMLTDAAGLFIALIANHISKKPATIHLTFGYGKVEALGSLINCFFTIIFSVVLFYEIITRVFKVLEINATGLFIVAILGLVINLLIICILSINLNSLNIKAVFIHAIADLFASAITMISGLLIYFTHINRIDTILSFLIVAILLYSNIKLIKKSIMILMSGVPENLVYDDIGSDMSKLEGVVSIHDLHIWYLTTNIVALSAHVVINNKIPWEIILYNCQKLLKENYNIEHVTLQNEVPNIYQLSIYDTNYND